MGKKPCFTVIAMLLCLLITTTVFADNKHLHSISENDVAVVIEREGKEAVIGNLFIWFLCAVGFLKISQKIDSFMAGLGVNVGRTGGSMLEEMRIAGMALGGMRGGVSKGFGMGRNSKGGTPVGTGMFSGGLSGMVGRQINKSAVNAATGNEAVTVGKAAFQSSLNSGGSYSKGIIGSIATGDISQMGSITGENAEKALPAYLGIGDEPIAASNQPHDGGIKTNISTESDTKMPDYSGEPSIANSPDIATRAGEFPDFMPYDEPSTGEGLEQGIMPDSAGVGVPLYESPSDMQTSDTKASGIVNEHMDIPSSTGNNSHSSSAQQNANTSIAHMQGTSTAQSIQASMNNNTTNAASQQQNNANNETVSVNQSVTAPVHSQNTQSMENLTTPSDGGMNNLSSPSIPQFTNVEMGGGRITGIEKNADNPNGIEFGMYNAEQYMKPDSNFTTIKSVDGQSWYKQYAVDSVERTPKVGQGGKIEYDEKIVQKMPAMPRRKDRV